MTGKGQNPLPERLEISPFAVDEGNLIGRDPREIPAQEWDSDRTPVGLKAIRAKCFDCCCGSAVEIRKCVVVTCPLWPLRMGSVPRGLQEARGMKGRVK